MKITIITIGFCGDVQPWSERVRENGQTVPVLSSYSQQVVPRPQD